RRRPGDRAREHPGRPGRTAGLGLPRRAPGQPGAGRDPGRVLRRRPDLGSGAYGDDPLLGVVFGVLTAITYALFILILRHGNADDRRPAGPLFDATLSAAVFS